MIGMVDIKMAKKKKVSAVFEGQHIGELAAMQVVMCDEADMSYGTYLQCCLYSQKYGVSLGEVLENHTSYNFGSVSGIEKNSSI